MSTISIVVTPTTSVIIVVVRSIVGAGCLRETRGLCGESWVRSPQIITIKKMQALLIEK